MSGDRKIDLLSPLVFSLALGCSLATGLFQPGWGRTGLAVGFVILSVILTYCHPTRIAGLAGIGGLSVLLSLPGSRSNIASFLIILTAVLITLAVLFKFIDSLTFSPQGVPFEDPQSVYKTKS